jgi:AraC-like DNA-binding protein
MRPTRFPDLEWWDLSESAHSRPTLLYAPTPLGLGTAYVESLASYVTRLAEAHVVSVWQLILHILFECRRSRVSRSSVRYVYPANGLGKDSEAVLRSLEAATARRDLGLLTLAALDGTVARRGVFRTTEAWCPDCLENWRATGAPLYSPLLWAIRIVKVCPIHSRPLMDRCQYCQSQFAPLRARAFPGYCSICSRWLGSPRLLLGDGSVDDRHYDLWAAASIGELLAALPQLQHPSLLTALQTNLQRCLRQTDCATKERLAVLAGACPGMFQPWISGRVRPTLGHLCRLAFQLNLPLLQLFQGVPAEWRGPGHLCHESDSQTIQRQSQPRIERSELRRLLMAILIECPAPTVAEIARRLKFRRTQTLVSREPELCKQIALRRRESGVTPSTTKSLYTRSEGHRLEAILRGYLAEENPPSINEIASKLGYKGAFSIRERFPELCIAVSAKRREQILRKRERMRRVLEDARVETPPPSLKQIGRRLGYTTEVVVVQTFPDLCHSYKQWRKGWFQDHRNKLHLSIREWLSAEAGPTVSSVCRRFGISAAYFQMHFPEENANVVRQSAECARKAREAREIVLRDEVFKVVQELLQRNLYPSLPRVKAALGPDTRRSSLLLRHAIDNALSRLGPVVRSRNELGQFA